MRIDLEKHILHAYDPASPLPVCDCNGLIVTVHCTDLAGVRPCLISYETKKGKKASLASIGSLRNYEVSPKKWYYNVYKRIGGILYTGAMHKTPEMAKEAAEKVKTSMSINRDEYIETLCYTEKGGDTK